MKNKLKPEEINRKIVNLLPKDFKNRENLDFTDSLDDVFSLLEYVRNLPYEECGEFYDLLHGLMKADNGYDKLEVDGGFDKFGYIVSTISKFFEKEKISAFETKLTKTESVDVRVFAKSFEEAVEKMEKIKKDNYQNYSRIDYIEEINVDEDGLDYCPDYRYFLGHCDNCNKILFDDGEHVYNIDEDDDVYYCDECFEKLKENKNE